MTGKPQLPPFSELKDRNAPPAPPPFESLTQTKGPNAEQTQHPHEKKKSKKGLNKRKKQAVNIQSFATQHGTGHAMFFRHIRVPDPHNREYTDGPMLPGPKGGATILVDMISEDKFRFSFAICNLEEGDAYVKDEARKMCQDRFREGQIISLTQRDAGMSCFENIEAAIKAHFRGWTHHPEDSTVALPQIEVIGSNISEESLQTLQRYIKKYGANAQDGEVWPAGS
jgi:hypothetical protein